MAKYSKEVLENAVRIATSINHVLRLLGIQPTGSSNRHIAAKIRHFNIDISHFTRQGARYKVGECLVLRTSGNRTHGHILYKGLMKIGRSEICEECGIGTLYNNKKLKLQVDHKNNNILDNRPDNLRLLCPNCHSQTASYSKSRTVYKLPDKYCELCNTKIYKNSKTNYCSKCIYKSDYMINRRKSRIMPSKDLLTELIWTMPTTEIAKSYSVSDTAVSKWCKKYGIVKPGPGHWSKSST